MTGIGDLGLLDLALIALAALAGSFASSLTGVGGAIVLSFALAPIVGIGALVPVLSVTMTVAHAVRIGTFWNDIDQRAAALILGGAVPGTLLGALVLVRLDERAIALALGLFLIVIVLARRLLAGRSFALPPALVVALSAGYGVLAGLTIGGGILVLPLLAAAGLSGIRLVATDALVGLVVHLTKSIVFGAAATLTAPLLVTGLLVGLLMVPGALLARFALRRMPLALHQWLIDAVILAGAVNFLIVAYRG